MAPLDGSIAPLTMSPVSPSTTLSPKSKNLAWGCLPRTLNLSSSGKYPRKLPLLSNAVQGPTRTTSSSEKLPSVSTIVPVKCFTCGKVLADKYRYYQLEIRKKKVSKKMEIDNVIYLTEDYINKTPEGEFLDNLGLNKYCCRRHMLTHVDIE